MSDDTQPQPHLSIGEVLALLQPEYPDITISKIRFLEGQGLLNPERTPSGYRKFRADDVEQLRWILRQQKDNFLPLKVIKQRLAAGQLEGPASASGLLDLHQQSQAGSGQAGPDPAGADQARNGQSSGNGQHTGTNGAVSPANGHGEAAAPSDRPTTETVSAARQPAVAAMSASASTSASASSASAGAAARPPATGLSGGSGGGGGDTARTDGSATGGGQPQPAGESPVGRTSLVSSVSMTAAELCAATGLSRATLGQLERLGLIVSDDSSGDVAYGDHALVVARVAAEMATYGLEVRHLRMFKVAADREAGLYEQVAAPRLVRADTAGRQEVAADVAALAGLGARLHSALLQQSLRKDLRQP